MRPVVHRSCRGAWSRNGLGHPSIGQYRPFAVLFETWRYHPIDVISRRTLRIVGSKSQTCSIDSIGYFGSFHHCSCFLYYARIPIPCYFYESEPDMPNLGMVQEPKRIKWHQVTKKTVIVWVLKLDPTPVSFTQHLMPRLCRIPFATPAGRAGECPSDSRRSFVI